MQCDASPTDADVSRDGRCRGLKITLDAIGYDAQAGLDADMGAGCCYLGCFLVSLEPEQVTC